MAGNAPIKLQLPIQDTASFEPFGLDAGSAHAWVQALPSGNARQTVQLLRQVIGDLNKVTLEPALRFNILEALRPSLFVATAALSRKFLNQPLVLPEELRQLAELNDSLFTIAGAGYALAAVQTIQQRDMVRDINPARLVCEALQRAIGFGGRKIMQAYQLYQPIEPRAWLTLHQLFSLAERQQLAHLPVVDPLVGSTSIATAYLQPLLLACCKPNQLRQSDIASIFRGLQEWSELIRVDDPATGKGLFLIDLNTDQPPFYAALLGDSPGGQCRYLDTERLVAHLEQLQQLDKAEGRKGITFDQDTTVPSNIIDHLITYLGTMSLRNFNRNRAGNKLWLGIGLSNAHYHLAGEVGFEQLLFGDQYIPSPSDRIKTNVFMKEQKRRDAWAEANPEQDYVRETSGPTKDPGEIAIEVDAATQEVLENRDLLADEPANRYPIHPAHAVNASPGGYCVEWEGKLPKGIRSGDLACVREDGSRDWVIAVIRWISQIKDAEALMGVELLSPRAMPYGATVQQKTGDEAEPMRVLLLPEIKLVGQPHTLVTPRSGFKEKQKITLWREGEKFLVQLLRLVAATSTYNQFDFRYIKQLEDTVEPKTSRSLSESGFNSMWDKI